MAIDGDHLIAAFSSIDGATTLRLRTAAGRTLESQEIAEWDRRQGWAVLRFPGHGLHALPRLSGRLAVGHRCYVLDSDEDGGRLVAEAAVVGQEAPPADRPRLNSGFAEGSPVIDEKGDLAGIVVGGVEEPLGPASWRTGLSGSMYLPRGALVALAERLPGAPAARVGLAELAARGQFLRPLSPEQRHVISGVFAGRVQRGGAVPMPQDQRFVFSRREGQVSVFVQWNPQAKKDAVNRFDLYDSDYRTIVKGEPNKVKLRPGELFFTTWTFGIGPLSAGVYRVDLLLDDSPIWRGYLRITD